LLERVDEGVDPGRVRQIAIHHVKERVGLEVLDALVLLLRTVPRQTVHDVAALE